MKDCKIYMLEFPNNKKYIGQSWDIKKRFSIYKNLRCKRQTLLYNAINKYGWDNIKKNIISKHNKQKTIDKLEKKYIRLYKTTNIKYGYNLRDGGMGGLHSDVTKKKMSIKKTGVPRTDEAKRLISLGCTGKKKSDIHRKNISNSRKGMKFSDIHRKNMSIARQKYLMKKNMNQGEKS